MSQLKLSLKEKIKALFEEDESSPVFKDAQGRIYSSFNESAELTKYLDEFIEKLIQLIEEN